MANRAQKLEQIRKLINGEEEGIIFFSLTDYNNGATPQPCDLFEGTNSTGQRVVRPYREIKGSLLAIVWAEGQAYEVGGLGGEIVVLNKETAENLKNLCL